VPIPDYQSLMLPVLLASSRGEVRIGPVVDDLADQLKLSPEDRSELLPSAPADSVQQPRALGEIVFKQSAAR